jgi:ribosomal-protein-serine acetyltransferase
VDRLTAPMVLPERLEAADGLVVRRWAASDAAAMADAVAEAVDHLRPWMPWIAAEPLSEDQRIALIRGWEREWVASGAAGLLTGAALALPGITHVEIHHDKANGATAGVPRRLGYRFIDETSREPTAPAEVGIVCRWRMDRAD